METDALGTMWVMKGDGSDRRPLSAEQRIRTLPVRCGQGKVVYLSRENQTSHLWVSALDGSNAKQLTNGVRETEPACSPDGKWVYFTTGNDAGIEKVAVEGGTPSPVMKDVHAAAISPDGKWIALHYTAPADQKEHKEHLAIAPLEGGAPLKVLPAPGTALPPRWTSDGSFLTYVDTVQGISNLWNQPVDGGPPRQLTHFADTGGLVGFDWSPDGKRLILTRVAASADIVMISGFE